MGLRARLRWQYGYYVLPILKVIACGSTRNSIEVTASAYAKYIVENPGTQLYRDAELEMAAAQLAFQSDRHSEWDGPCNERPNLILLK